jgi:hypothetical protein
MRPKDIYKQSNAEGIQNGLTALQIYDEDLTIKEIRAVLNDLLPKSIARKEDISKQLIDETLNKCYCIVFSKQHTVWLLIDKVELEERYGSMDVKLFGKQITSYKGELKCDELTGEDYWHQFNPNHKKIQKSKRVFNETWDKIEAIKKEF